MYICIVYTYIGYIADENGEGIGQPVLTLRR